MFYKGKTRYKHHLHLTFTSSKNQDFRNFKTFLLDKNQGQKHSKQSVGLISHTSKSEN